MSEWKLLPRQQRCRIVASVSSRIAASAESLTALCASGQRTDPVETITAELLPLCSALRHIGRRGPRILATRRCGMLGRPAWLWGIQSTVRRDPHGRVLVLGTWNYPLLLAGTQTAQALAAGNTVLLKPAVGSEAATRELVDCFRRAGIPADQLVQLDSSTESALAAMEAGVDLIVLTGAASTGRKVLAKAAETVTPTIMELSGCDAVVVMPSAKMMRTAAAIDFSLNFNGGATCISPRRLIVQDDQADALISAIGQRLKTSAAATVHPAARDAVASAVQLAIEQGAIDQLGHFDAALLQSSGTLRPIVLDRVGPTDSIASADLFAPITSVIRVPQISDAIKIVNDCRYRLAASVFGNRHEALKLANQLQVGSVAINDLLVPTADPRLPFGGRGDSGFGVTRGDEGLLAMTVPTVISQRRGRFVPHLDLRRNLNEQMMTGSLQFLHGGSLARRLAGLRRMVRAVKTGRPSKRNKSSE